MALSKIVPLSIASDAVETAKILDNNVTLAKLGDGTQGDILYYGASGAPARLGFGTSGDFLKTQGTGANPVWASAGGKVKQIVRADATGKTADNTDYSSAEGGTIGDIGTAHITIAFTPTSATSIIYVSASAGGGTESNTSNGSAIFGGATCRAWFNNNGYNVDASGHALHASWVSGSTSAVDIEFRTIGSYIGSNTTLGNMRGTGDATAPYGTMTVMEIEP